MKIAILVISFHILMLMAPILPSYGFGTIVLVYGLTFVAGAAKDLTRRACQSERRELPASVASIPYVVGYCHAVPAGEPGPLSRPSAHRWTLLSDFHR